jgi:hypothetical protein
MKFKTKNFHIYYTAYFHSAFRNNNLSLWVAKPQNSNYQKINKVIFSHQPLKKYQDKQGNEIVHFQFDNFSEINFSIGIEAELWQSRLNSTDTISICKNSARNRRYLKDEKYLKQTSKVKKLGHQLTGQINTQDGKIHALYDYIIKNFNYKYPVLKRGVENLNLNDLRGDCGESSALFVALCRLLKIPARNNTGFVIYPEKSSIVEHGWASFCRQGYSWIDVDCQYASLQKNADKASVYFARRPDYRLVFTNGFNIPLQPKIPSNYSLKYWNNLGLPMSYDSVQTLQPLVFASNKQIKFEDNIALK